MLMPNGAAGWISIEFGARAGAHALVSACASGAEAIGYGIDMIRSGRADVVLAGGTEAAIMPLNIGAFAVMRAMSTRNDEPERASRPFDKGRDGFVLGEGAGMLVLESAGARARPAAPGLRGGGRGRLLLRRATTSRQPDPDGEGVTVGDPPRAGRRATSTRAQIVHMNAHATSTPAATRSRRRPCATALGPTRRAVVIVRPPSR